MPSIDEALVVIAKMQPGRMIEAGRRLIISIHAIQMHLVHGVQRLPLL